MLSKLLRLIFPPKPQVGADYTSQMHDARTIGVRTQQESRRSRQALRAEWSERTPEPTGYAVIDLATGNYDPKHPIYRGKGGAQ